MSASLALPKSLVLIGMPGSGKSTLGRILASRLALPFRDSDQEIEDAAGMSISNIFATLGEPAFRDGERKVIARLLQGERCVLSTGGGAFMNEETRALIKKLGLSIWLKADLPVLLDRCSRSDDRPLLKKGDPETILRDLMAVREPVFGRADITVQTADQPFDTTLAAILAALENHLKAP